MKTITITLSAGKKGKNSTNSPVEFQKRVIKALNTIVAAPTGTYVATFTSGPRFVPQDIIINKPPT